MDGLERATGKTFFWAGALFRKSDERITLTTELNVFRCPSSRKLPENIEFKIRLSGEHLRRICSATCCIR